MISYPWKAARPRRRLDRPRPPCLPPAALPSAATPSRPPQSSGAPPRRRESDHRPPPPSPRRASPRIHLVQDGSSPLRLRLREGVCGGGYSCKRCHGITGRPRETSPSADKAARTSVGDVVADDAAAGRGSTARCRGRGHGMAAGIIARGGEGGCGSWQCCPGRGC